MLVQCFGNVKMLCKCKQIASTGQKAIHNVPCTHQLICFYQGGLFGGKEVECQVHPLAPGLYFESACRGGLGVGWKQQFYIE